MFQKYNALLNQTKKLILYHFFLPWRMLALTMMLMFLWCASVMAQIPVKIDVGLTDPILIWGQTAVIVIMLMLFFAIGRSMRKQQKLKNVEQQRMIAQMQINEMRSQTLNAELSALLEDRNIELKKSMEIIEKQNEEISMMNAILKRDTKGLDADDEQLEKRPNLSKFSDFETFSKIYPDKDAILKYVAGLKWSKGYSCIRCYNETFLVGQTPYGRRCTKCGYDESATVNTIFHNSKILLNKALYMLIMVYNTKGTISSYKLAELLDIRQSTCWVYSSRFKKKLLQSKSGPGKTDGEGWKQMVLDPNH